jgi:hypothetical protein
MGQQVPRRQLGHLACAHQINALALQVAENLLARSTATEAIDTADVATAVSLRTRLATAKARVSSASSCELTAPTARAVA